LCAHAASRSKHSTEKSSGFALPITLLVFLVLLLVSLVTLTRVETQMAGNSQKLSSARTPDRILR